MTFEAALRNKLITIKALKNKVFPISAPEGTGTPYLVYLATLPRYDKTLSGFEETYSIAVELNIIHANPTQLRALSKEVQSLVISLERTSLSDYYVEELTLGDGRELYEAQADLYRRMFEATFYLKEEK